MSLEEKLASIKGGKPDEPEQGETILVVPVPIQVFGEVMKLLNKLPREDTELLWNHLEQLKPQQAKVQQ